MSHLPSSHANCEASKPPLVFLHVRPCVPDSPLLLVIVAPSWPAKWSIDERNGRKTVMPVPMCVLFPRGERNHQPSLPGRDGSGRFLIWQGVGLYTDGEGTVAVCEGGYEPHDVLHASRVFLWILPNAFDHSKRRFLFTYASPVPADTWQRQGCVRSTVNSIAFQSTRLHREIE